MAQYGRSYYGASYYGVNGVFSGQFTSDQIILATPLSGVAPSDGKLYFDIISNHPRVTYTYPNDIFERAGTWNGNQSSDAALSLVAAFVGSTFTVNYARRASDGASVNIQVQTYVGGTLVNTSNVVANTTTGSSTVIEPPQFGEQIVTITKVSGGIFEFTSITAMTTDIKMEYKSKNGSGVWSNWTAATLTTLSGWTQNSPENGFNNVYKYSAVTSNIAGHTAYQFKIYMGTSDDTNTPEILSLDVHSASSNDHAPEGVWKTTVDLGAQDVTINYINYDAVTPAGTTVEIRSRTGSVDGSYGEWSVPYSSAAARVMLNTKADSNIVDGYILTPVMSPENLTTWVNFRMGHFIDNVAQFVDPAKPFNKVGRSGSQITVQIVKAVYNPLAPKDADVLLPAFAYTTPERLVQNLAKIPAKTNIRMRINLTRNKKTFTPAIDYVDVLSNAYYIEEKEFGPAKTYKGLGSAVFGGNTGIDAVYIDNQARTLDANINRLAFTIPTGAENPEYVIEIDDTFAQKYSFDEVDLYWNSNTAKSVHLENGLTNDYVVCRVKEVGKTVKKHYKYASGIVTFFEPKYMTDNIPGIFTPLLDANTKYAYFVQNGFPANPNLNVDVRWSLERAVDSTNRRNIVYSLTGQPVCISIIASTTKGLIEWISEEKKFAGIVNNNGNHKAYSAIITDLPEIEAGVVLNPDPTIVPYEVAVVEGSVTSQGKRQKDDRVSGLVRYLYAIEGTPSISETTEERVPVVRGSGSFDYLPKAMVKGITAVYSLPEQAAAYYQKDLDYTYTLPEGGYSNKIDWTKGISGVGGAKAPAPGSVYYVTYKYDKIVALRVEFTCDYKEYEISPQMYKSPTIKRSGQCSPSYDYVSAALSLNDFTIDDNVDRTTLRYVIYDDNPRVRTYIDKGKVIGTMDNKDPRESWNPLVYGGYYYIGKDAYYMYTNQKSYSLGSSLIPVAENISYEDGTSGRGVLLEEATENLLSNTVFNNDTVIESVFTDTFTR